MHAHRSTVFSLQQAKPTDLLSATETSPRQAGLGFEDPCKPDTDAGVCCFHSRLPSAPPALQTRGPQCLMELQTQELRAQPSSSGTINAAVMWGLGTSWMVPLNVLQRPRRGLSITCTPHEAMLKQFTKSMLCKELGIAIYLVSLSVPCYVTTQKEFCPKEIVFREVIPRLLLVKQKQTNTNAAV